MNISSWSIKNPIPAVLLFILLTLLGTMSFKRMIVQEYPDIELPMVIITTILPGASPDQLENEVARKLENAISNISNIKHIYSVIAKSSVTTIVELQLDKNLSDAMNDIRDTLNRVRSDLPTDITEQHIGKIDTAGRPILTYVVTSPNKDEAAISRWVDNKVFKVLQTVRGVGNVSRIGGVDREIRVEVDPIRMAALNASIADISRQIQRVQQEASGGIAELNGVKQTVRIIGTLETAADIANLEIPLSDGRRIKLNQVADVSDTYSERLSSALLDGESVVAFEVTRAKGASEIDVANKVRAALKTLHTDESHIDVVEAFNGVDAVTDAYSGSMQLLYEGALLAVFVVWLFLRDWRATFISTLALPLSVIPTFALIHYMGFSLNTVTLQSLALVVGILVDDAIVEIENIVRHLRMGKSPKQAAMDAADEIGLAVVATTLTLVAVFLPTIFMTGITGKFFTQFGWTSSIAILFSLLVARLLTPMMAAYLLKPVVTQKKTPG
jgi:Cation/multidrug efflux pump